ADGANAPRHANGGGRGVSQARRVRRRGARAGKPAPHEEGASEAGAEGELVFAAGFDVVDAAEGEGEGGEGRAVGVVAPGAVPADDVEVVREVERFGADGELDAPLQGEVFLDEGVGVEDRRAAAGVAGDHLAVD